MDSQRSIFIRPLWVGDNALPRQRLFALLDRGQCIWVEGASGSGKTFLVCSYLTHVRSAQSYVVMRPGTDLCLQLFESLFAALGSHWGASTPMADWDSARHASLDAYAQQFFENIFEGGHTDDLINRRFVLVLDDAGGLTSDPEIQQVLACLIESSPPALRVIVTSQAPPPSAIQRARARRGFTDYVRPVDLLYTPEEALLFCRTNLSDALAPSPSDLQLRELAEQAGWFPAWVTLMLGELNAGTVHGGHSPIVEVELESMFWLSLRPETRATVCQLACLDEIFESEVFVLTQDHGASTLLRKWAHACLLVYERIRETGVGQRAFVLHDLLRRFLLEKLKSEFPLDVQRDFWRRAAAANLRQGRMGQAVDCFLNADDQIAAMNTIQAMRLYERRAAWRQGLANWLARLVVPAMQDKTNRGWYELWSGDVLSVSLGEKAFQHYEMALECFTRARHLEGICLAWSGAVRCKVLDWADFSSLNRWAVLGDGIVRDPDFRTLPMSLQVLVLTCQFDAMLFSDPYQISVEQQALVVENLLKHLPSPDARIFLGHTLYIYYSVIEGDRRKGGQLLDDMLGGANESLLDPLARVLIATNRAQFYWSEGKTVEAENAVAAGRAVLATHDLQVLEFLLSAQSAYAYLTGGYRHLAHYEVRRLHACLPPSATVHAGHWLYLACFEALLQDNFKLALELAQQGVDNAMKYGGEMQRVMMGLASCTVTLLQAWRQGGADVKKTVVQLRRIAQQIQSGPGRLQRAEAEVLLLFADLVTGERKQAAAGFSAWLRRYPDTTQFSCVSNFAVPSIMAALASLETKVEDSRRGELVQRRRLWRSNHGSTPVITFNRTSMQIGDKPMPAEPSKIATLLKLLLAAWPEPAPYLKTFSAMGWKVDSSLSSADKQFQPLHQTISDLNKLMLHDQGVARPVSADKRTDVIVLDALPCRLDVAIFLDDANVCAQLVDTGPREVAYYDALFKQAVDCYRGPFLGNHQVANASHIDASDAAESSVQEARERLRQLAARAINKILARLDHPDTHYLASRTRRRALEIDPLLPLIEVPDSGYPPGNPQP